MGSFFYENKFLIGLSIDGTREVHDLNRVDHSEKGTFSRILKTTDFLRKESVDFNILTVVTRMTTRKVRSIYNDYKKRGYDFLQFIPCLDSLNDERGGEGFSLLPKDYTHFLITLFDLWYIDISNGKMISIRFFDNILGMYLGIQPESCDMVGRCSIQHVVESDGSLYPCDFYVLDHLNLGNINCDELSAMHQNPIAQEFVAESTILNEACKSCKWFNLCRGGCKRNRDETHLNYYCESFKSFYDYSYSRFKELAVKFSNNR